MNDHLASLLSTSTTLEASQSDLLINELIVPNAQTTFGQEHGFADIESFDDYRRSVPLTDYEGIRHYVDGVSSGEQHVLTRARTLALFQTSGSMSKPKYIPVTTELMRQKVGMFAAFWEKIYQDYPDVRDGKMVSNFSDSSEPEKLPSGLSVYSESSFWSKRGRSLHSLDRWPLPTEIRSVKDPDLRAYASARILLQSDLHCIMCLNPSTLLHFCRTLEEHLPALRSGLENGSWGGENDPALSKLEDTHYKELSQHLISNTDAAKRIDESSSSGSTVELKRLWPMLNVIICWHSKVVQPYFVQLAPYTKGVATRDYITQSSECMMAIPLEDGMSGGILAHTAHFFEFIPENQCHKSDPQTLGAWELTIGERYEIVVSTGGGLYRYRMGDCVQVNGMAGNAPVIEFLYRVGRTSSMTGEKLTEFQVISAAANASNYCGFSPEEFLCFPCNGHKPHYAIAMDEGSQIISDDKLSSWAEQFDQELRLINSEYSDKCESQRLGNVVVFKAANGTLRNKRLQRRNAGVSEEQVKSEVLSAELDWHKGKEDVVRVS